ncbi:MAG: hypothetical protein ABW208_03775 [Pyrinomonadaceae bacterium]
MIPWWVVNTFSGDPEADFGPLNFSALLSLQLERWSRRSGVMNDATGKWWHIDTPDLPPPETPAELHDNLNRFVLNSYPLRRHGGQPPAISGLIDNTELRIALVGDVRDRTSRTYLHCLGKFIRLNALTLLDPIDIKLLAFVNVPHDAHLDPGREGIALFLAELHTMMLQPPAHRPFDWVVISQDKNFSPPRKRSGYDQLAPDQLTQMMAQTLFHAMIGEGRALRDIAENYSPAYLSVGSVSFYYDWGQHKHRLAEQTSRALVNKFTTSKDPPFIDFGEVETALSTIQARFKTQRLLDELLLVSDVLARELTPPREEDKADLPVPGDATEPPTARADDAASLYRAAVRRSQQRLEKGGEILWKGGLTFRSTERTLIESVQGIFVGEYGEGGARALEQALLVLGKLEALFEERRLEVQLTRMDDAAFSDILKALDLHVQPAPPPPPPPEEPGGRGGDQFSAIALLQLVEWLATVPLWAKVIAGLLFGGSGYTLYRKLKARQARSALPPREKDALPPAKDEDDDEKKLLHNELRGKVQTSLTHIYVRAIRLVKKLELFIGEVREKANKESLPFEPVYAYRSTAFFRSVFDELAVPGRPAMKPLISNGSFAPPLPVNERLVKFKDFEDEELCFLINEFLDERPKKALPVLAPAEIGEADPQKLSDKSAEELPVIFYDFAADLYERSAPLSMDAALRYIKAAGEQERLLSFVAELASPPVIFSPGSVKAPDPFVEFKYHDGGLIDEVFAVHLDERKQEPRVGVESINDGDLLSVGVYQPILTSRQGEFPSLDSIHTIAAMSGPTTVRATPSLVFTLATLAHDSTLAPIPALISPTDGGRLLPPEPVARDISLFRRQLVEPLYGFGRRPVKGLLPEYRGDDEDDLFKEPAATGTGARAGATYDVMAMAGIKDHPADLPFHVGAEYVLQAGLKSTVPEGFSAAAISLPAGEESFEFHLFVHADGMQVRPDWAQTLTYKPGAESSFVEFRLSPGETGSKLIRVEFLYQRHWIAHIRLEVEVINAHEPVFTA